MDDIEYLKIMHKHFIGYLVARYDSGEAAEIACLCDETLDRSGRLLGDVRKASRTWSE